MVKKEENGVDITKLNVTILIDRLKYQVGGMLINEEKRQIITKFTQKKLP